MILFSLFYFVPENEHDMLFGFGLFLGGILHFRREKRIFAKSIYALEQEIGTEAKEISCFVKFYLTELL